MNTKISFGKITDIIFNSANHIFLALFSLICIYLFYYIFIYSISDPAKAAGGLTLLPMGLSFETYEGIFMLDTIAGAFFISLSRTIIGTALMVFLSAMFAYLLTKKELYLRRFIYRFMVITMYLGAGLIPFYLTLKAYGLRNSFFVYIIPGCISAFNVILVKTYIEQLPASMEESAMIDGASFIKIFTNIIFPLSKPIIATITIFGAVGGWNSWMDNLFFVSSQKLMTLQLLLYNYLSSAELTQQSMQNLQSMKYSVSRITPRSVQMCITMIVTLPIILVYPVLQRYFIKGIMIGAIKA